MEAVRPNVNQKRRLVQYGELEKTEELDLCLSNRIARAYHQGELISAFVTGQRRYGKTAYALKSAYQSYRLLGCDKEQAWEKTLDSLYFNLDDILEVLDYWSERPWERAAVIIWDDVGVHGNKYRYFSKTKEVEMLKALMDVVGTCTSALIMTTPKRKGTLKFLHEYDNLHIQISKRNSNYARTAKGYNQYTLPSGTPKISKDYEDDYSCHVPKRYYEQYAPKRRKLASDVISEIKEAIEEVGADNPEERMKEDGVIQEEEMEVEPAEIDELVENRQEEEEEE